MLKELEGYLKDRTIVGVEIDTKRPEWGFSLQLDNGKVLSVRMEGGPGADAGWYQWLVARMDDTVIFRG